VLIGGCGPQKNKIIDPTASQYNTLYYGFTCIETYYEIPEENRPTGRCMNCGCYCYNGRTMLCSENCEKEYYLYITGSLR